MKFPQMGPAFLVTAAFIGPGTVITASLAGANFGFSLLWALLFSVVATIILQEMAARLGVVTQQGLGENIRQSLTHPTLRYAATFLVVSAIVIGNAAYQGGNLSGASLGLSGLFRNANQIQAGNVIWPMVIGAIAFILLWTGKYKVIEKSLVLLVALMSLSFIATLILSKPDLVELFGGLVTPHIPTGASLTVIALIGTTVVPYNLFLHSASVSRKWKNASDLPLVRKDLYVSISLGGLISMAILSTAATAFFGQQVQIQSAADLAPALAPIFGTWSEILMALGLFSAGISSAITAPLAAAFALNGILNLDNGSDEGSLSKRKFRLIWMTILILGTLVASSGYRPISIIWFAQVANGILLPVVTVFLIWIMNHQKLGKYRNTLLQNLLGASVLLITLLLSGRSLMSAFGLL
jgi:Mn2+/Fe2+ NRAMP family transporter